MADIPIITYEAVRAQTRRDPDHELHGPFARVLSEEPSRSWVSAETLRSNFKELLGALESTLTMPDSIGSFQVDALDIQLEITAEGQIGLLGTGGKLGGKGSLTLRLKRSAAPKSAQKKASAGA
jgi:hypothetical protein